MTHNETMALLNKKGIVNDPYSFKCEWSYPGGYRSIGTIVEPDRDWKIHVATTLQQEYAANLIRDGINPRTDIRVSRGMRGIEDHLFCVIKLESEYGRIAKNDEYDTIVISTEELCIDTHQYNLEDILKPGNRIGHLQIVNGSTAYPYDEWLVPDPSEDSEAQIEFLYNLY